MSYAFKITKDADGIRLEDVSEGMLEHIPDGTFSISGHHVDGKPGYSATETIRVQLISGDHNVISATAEAQAGSLK